MLLQKLLWPRVGICTEDRLYYRMKAPSFRDEGDILRIEQGERVCFDTYFNSVSADKWRRYTAAQNFSLRLKLSGKLRVVLCSRHFINSQSVRAVLAEKVVQADSVQEFCFDFPKGADGMLFFELQALSGNAAYAAALMSAMPMKRMCSPSKSAWISAPSAGSRSLWATLPACAAIFWKTPPVRCTTTWKCLFPITARRWITIS